MLKIYTAKIICENCFDKPSIELSPEVAKWLYRHNDKIRIEVKTQYYETMDTFQLTTGK